MTITVNVESDIDQVKSYLRSFFEQEAINVYGKCLGSYGRYFGVIRRINIEKGGHTCMDWDTNSLAGYMNVTIELE